MAKLHIGGTSHKGTVNPEIYGHFSEHLGRCIYGGIYVGEDSPIKNVNGMRCDVIEALKKMQVPVLRWPGGCFADEYHWKDGIGPKEERKRMVNTHWGGVVEDNSFGTHEFMELCRQLGCEPYVNANVGSGTVQEMNEWVEYMTFDGVSPMAAQREANGHKEPWHLKYLGVGNENWGCGGNMRPSYYADEYRRYQTYCRNYGDNKLYKIACGPNVDDYEWTDTVMSIAGRYMDGLSMHYYTVPTGVWADKGSATEFDTNLYYATLKKTMYMEALVRRHSEIMDKYDPEKRVGLLVDEWGCWHNVEPGTNPGFLYQQNTMRDAVVAGLNLNIFNKNCDRVKMANIAQLVNVLQSVILTDGDDMLLTPTYHVFEMYKHHQGGQLMYSTVENFEVGEGENWVPNLQESVTRDADGKLHITLVNTSATESYPIETVIDDFKPTAACAELVTGAIDAHNTFENKTVVEKQTADVTVTDTGLAFTIPACSVMHITVE